jgi:hypothetical protein
MTNPTLTQKFAETFACEWIEAWNSHDLERILSHYSDDFEMTSPLIGRVLSSDQTCLRGKPAVAAYWSKALALVPNLAFDLLGTLVGADSLVLYYRSSMGNHVAEVLTFNAQGLVCRGSAHYGV